MAHHVLLKLLAVVFSIQIMMVLSGDYIRVLNFNPDGRQRENTWIKYNSSVQVPKDYTLCVRFNIRVFRLLTAVIYLLNTNDYDDDPISFEVYFEKIRTKYGGYGRFYPLPANLATSKWYHYCQVRDMTEGEGRVYIDGQLIIQEKTVFQTNFEARYVVIGQDEFKPPYSLSGRLTQVNLWDRVLSPEFILSLAQCEIDDEGDVITWSSSWQLYDVQEESVPLEELCRSVSYGQIMVPLPLLRFRKAVHVCKGLRGTINVPANSKEIFQELSYFQNTEECDRQWAGITDQSQEGVWHNVFSGISYNTSALYFRQNNPDGDKYQNCIRLHEKGLEDTSCQKHSCSACHATAGTTWTLRGICEEEERMYYLDLIPEPLSFRGYGEYLVEQTANGDWVWYNTVTNVTKATLTTQHLDYPIGRHAWEIQSSVCDQNSGMRELTLSACSKSEFTCTDGFCIPFSRRCDLKFDCEDKTDESFCDIVNFPEDYRSKLAPRPASDEALSISVNVSMDSLNIDTTKMLLLVSYNLQKTWFDNRLTYNNLKLLTRLNTISRPQVDRLWRPKIGFINTDDIQHTKVDDNAVTTILRHDARFLPDLSSSYEVEIYRGDTNPVSTTRKYFTIYTCNFNLVLYPFDIQNCYMRLQILSASSEYLVFNPTESFVEYLGPKLLVEYGIGTIDLQVDNSTQYSVLRVQVELIRRYGYAMLNIYIPSLTLLIISFVTLFFRPNIFEVRVMTALTALLVLATLFTQVSTSLPKTSYFKMVDIWLLFCIMLIFIIIIFHTIIDLHVDYSNDFGNSSSSGMNKKVNWAKRRSSADKVCSIKIRPTPEELAQEEPMKKNINQFKIKFLIMKSTKIDVRFYILSSKWTVFLIFVVFNLTYWGTLAKDSGLVYYK